MLLQFSTQGGAGAGDTGFCAPLLESVLVFRFSHIRAELAR